MIMEMMARVLEEVHNVKKELRDEFKQGLVSLKSELRKEVASKQDLALAVEIIRGDLVGANSDRLAQHEDKISDHGKRIVKIEKKLSMAI